MIVILIATAIAQCVVDIGNSSPDDTSLREYWHKRAAKQGKNYWAK
ncbi:hypothetical protein GTQ43_38220 [Nostoc sp. KVJ3]|nr:hypothetical protein [Nostoc sp. KVJ3]